MTDMQDKFYPSKAILVVDDETETLKALNIALCSAGYTNTILCSDSREVYNILESKNIGIVLLDLMMPHIRGEEILSKLLFDYPGIPVTIISAVNDIPSAVKCVKEGAFDYITKPVEMDKLLNSVSKAIKYFEIQQEISELKTKLFSTSLSVHEAFSEIITNNPRMKSIFKYCEAITRSSQPVLISGETGTGKELFARAIYKLTQSSGKFVPVNAAGLDDNMFSDTLFGHVKGAYTGASDFREGLIKKAQNGILFLDEIGDLSLQSQIKLLRLLQEREYSPLGSDLAMLSNAKVILATNKELPELLDSGKFRKDLYFRLSAHQIKIPPLRERIDDVPLLLDFFINQASNSIGLKAPTYHPDLIQLLMSYQYPGNVREFQGMVFNAINKHKSHMLSSRSFKEYIDDAVKKNKHMISNLILKDDTTSDVISQLPLLPSLKEMGEILINESMKRSNGNQAVASRLLGLTPQALNKRLKSKKK